MGTMMEESVGNSSFEQDTKLCVGQAAAKAEQEQWNVGEVYSIIPGRLSFAMFSTHKEAQDRQKASQDLLFVSGEFQDLYLPFASDFGPVNLGVIHSFCQFLRSFSTCPNEVVYYSVSRPPSSREASSMRCKKLFCIKFVCSRLASGNMTACTLAAGFCGTKDQLCLSPGIIPGHRVWLFC